MTAMTAGWVLDWRPAVVLFSGAAGALCAAGAFLTRLMVSGESVARRVAAEVEQDEHQARQQALDDLDRKLTAADRDPRPETALRDLRALVKAFEDGASD